MDENLKKAIIGVRNGTSKLDLKGYSRVMKLAVSLKKLDDVVFLFDHMKSKNIKPTDEIFETMMPVHQKKLKNSKYDKKQSGKLQPSRRIHKIMKGYLVKKRNTKLKDSPQKIENVKTFLLENPSFMDLAYSGRFRLVKLIRKNCKVNQREARDIITHLKRTKFFSGKSKIPIPSTKATKRKRDFEDKEEERRPKKRRKID